MSGFKPVFLKKDTFTGKLYKRGKFNKGWKGRFFTVYQKEQKIEYYSSSGNRELHKNLCGSIDLCTVLRIEVIDADFQIQTSSLTDHIGHNSKAKSDKKYTFQLITSNRTYVFAAFTGLSLLIWLQYLQSCLYGEVIKEGWLQKQGGKNKRKWENRYFVLNNFRQIKYYEDTKQTSCHGTIDCKNIVALRRGKAFGDGLEHTLELKTDDSKTYILAATSKKEQSEWMKFINMGRAKDWEQKFELYRMTVSGSNDSKEDNEEKVSGATTSPPLTIHKRPKDDDSSTEEKQPPPQQSDNNMQPQPVKVLSKNEQSKDVKTAGDYFAFCDANYVTLSNNKRTIKKKGFGERTCYGSTTIKYNSSGIRRWKIKILSVDGYCVIGIDEGSHTWLEKAFYDVYCRGTMHYGYWSCDGKKVDEEGDFSSFGSEYTAGDVVEMVFNLNKKTLGFGLNGSEIKHAFNVKAPSNGSDGTYCLAVYLYRVGDSVTLLPAQSKQSATSSEKDEDIKEEENAYDDDNNMQPQPQPEPVKVLSKKEQSKDVKTADDYFEFFDANYITLSNNKRTIKKKSYGETTCYGSTTIKYNSSGIRRWKIKILSADGYCVIGIDEGSHTWLEKPFYDSRGTMHYGYWSCNGKKVDEKGNFSSFGSEYTTGDVVEMVFNLNKKTLGFGLNGSEIKHAFHVKAPSSGSDGTYCLAVYLYRVGDSVTLPNEMNEFPAQSKQSATSSEKDEDIKEEENAYADDNDIGVAETKLVRLKRLIDTAELKLSFYVKNPAKFTEIMSFCMYSVLEDTHFFSDDELWDTYRNDFDDGKTEDRKKVLHILRNVIVKPYSKMGRKFKEWCKRGCDDSDFDRIKKEYHQMLAQKNGPIAEKKSEPIPKVKANRNDNVKKSKIAALKWPASKKKFGLLKELMSIGTKREKVLNEATVDIVETFAKYVVVEDLYDFEQDALLQFYVLYYLTKRNNEQRKKKDHIARLLYMQPAPAEMLQRYEAWTKQTDAAERKEIVRAYDKLEMAEDVSNGVVDEEEAESAQNSKGSSSVSNNAANKSGGNKAARALYCAACGFGHKGKECGKCGKKIMNLKVKAHLCSYKCGFGHGAKKCIKCGKPTFSRGVQVYLCSSSCGFGHKAKKCVKCGTNMFNIP